MNHSWRRFLTYSIYCRIEPAIGEEWGVGCEDKSTDNFVETLHVTSLH
ncbi:hypothetical protein H6G17_24015 [Chroococcidiopsis sp. FACHB-1243]|nr:hypothetical protein [Chroococcidiopsis sp. [FACHB-1243]]MBD2308540.1 hypothetical protein [Chroococcidiopsis sp. [FACHB-1243]]